MGLLPHAGEGGPAETPQPPPAVQGENTGRDRAGPGGTGRDRAGPGGTGRDRAGPGGTGRDRAGPGGTGRDRAGPGGTGRDRAGPGGTGRDRAGPGGDRASWQTGKPHALRKSVARNEKMMVLVGVICILAIGEKINIMLKINN